ncbi:MAG: hypothetical protein LBL61_05730 [Elusimicrobiota bacterium]|jgi:Skp family chaperone for outer membrane proteins|nr:hypothetical protein [Elusimicrobiota bacterium]
MKQAVFFVLMCCVCCVYAQQTVAVFEDENQTAAQPPDAQKLPMGAADTTVIVPAAESPAEPEPELVQIPAMPDAAQQEEEPSAPATTQTAVPPEQAAQKNLKKGFALGGTQEDLFEETPLPAGTLAVYIDIEEAFNKNPWTLQARRGLRLELETKQLEYAQIQQQLKELRLKEKNLNEETAYYKPYYEPLRYIEAPADNVYPKLQRDALEDTLTLLSFSPADERTASPENTPQKATQLEEAVKDTKKSILEKEAYLLNYKELSREEVLSRQDYIVQEVLKEIYSGIQEYAKVRNIGLIVDKKNLIYGKPLNVTSEFIKWMKTYHKKYLKEHGDIL